MKRNKESRYLINREDWDEKYLERQQAVQKIEMPKKINKEDIIKNEGEKLKKARKDLDIINREDWDEKYLAKIDNLQEDRIVRQRKEKNELDIKQTESELENIDVRGDETTNDQEEDILIPDDNAEDAVPPAPEKDGMKIAQDMNEQAEKEAYGEDDEDAETDRLEVTEGMKLYKDRLSKFKESRSKEDAESLREMVEFLISHPKLEEYTTDGEMESLAIMEEAFNKKEAREDLNIQNNSEITPEEKAEDGMWDYAENFDNREGDGTLAEDAVSQRVEEIREERIARERERIMQEYAEKAEDAMWDYAENFDNQNESEDSSVEEVYKEGYHYDTINTELKDYIERIYGNDKQTQEKFDALLMAFAAEEADLSFLEQKILPVLNSQIEYVDREMNRLSEIKDAPEEDSNLEQVDKELETLKERKKYLLKTKEEVLFNIIYPHGMDKLEARQQELRDNTMNLTQEEIDEYNNNKRELEKMQQRKEEYEYHKEALEGLTDAEKMMYLTGMGTDIANDERYQLYIDKEAKDKIRELVYSVFSREMAMVKKPEDIEKLKEKYGEVGFDINTTKELRDWRIKEAKATGKNVLGMFATGIIGYGIQIGAYAGQLLWDFAWEIGIGGNVMKVIERESGKLHKAIKGGKEKKKDKKDE